MSTSLLRAVGLNVVAFLLLLLLIWWLPLHTTLTSTFAPGTLYPRESNTFLGTYHWTADHGTMQIPLRWWSATVIMHQELSSGQEARPLRLQSAGHTLDITLAAGQTRRYMVLLPIRAGWAEIDFALPPIGPSTHDPRSLGMIVRSSHVEHLAQTAPLPGVGLLLLALIAPLSLWAGAIWELRQWRWICTIALGSVVGYSYATTGIPTITLAPNLLIGLLIIIAAGTLFKQLRSSIATWPGLVLLLSLGFSLIPLFLVITNQASALPQAWLLLLIPVLSSVAFRVASARPILAIISATATLVWAGLYAYPDVLLRSPSDFYAYYTAAQHLLTGQPLYDLEALASNAFATTYKYPPITALLISPLAQLPFPLAGAIWRLLCGLGAVVGVIALQKQATSRTSIAIGVGLIIALSPVSRSLRFGQPELLIFAGGVIASLMLLHKRTWASALLWALLALAKIYPLLFTLPLLIRGRWRWMGAFGVGIIGWSLFSNLLTGWDLVFWRDLFPSLGARDGRLSNLALYGLLARLVEPTTYSGGGNIPSSVAGLALILGAGLYIMSTFLIWKHMQTNTDASFWEASGLITCTVLLIIPVSWDHYQALLLLPLLVSMNRLSQANADLLLWLGAYSLLIFGVSRDIWPVSSMDVQRLAMFFGSYRTIGMLLLWIWFARRMAAPVPMKRSL
ncbi:hypothetical protein OSCT_1179 [Oscillochloris trichoides DG-6]|uniref:DUF2029 domain-containing protein n=1 Tax=Oscillochloris trichoides DG-6 TaxID=765420 RepID=E1ICX8_9CHLR|nr:glycosyltransferase family 87 protein [Oscillochloris trichoides]EFO80948.1 hypothetical protein OSCT_1179 [Oscillochloris trichoides DG-6]